MGTGIAFDPNNKSNHFAYLYYTYLLGLSSFIDWSERPAT
jgi:hypothetical protein